MSTLVKGRVYALHSRNLIVGVYDGDRGFIGIREKFGSRYLFTEYLHDPPRAWGTVRVVADLGANVPSDIPLVEGWAAESKWQENGPLFELLAPLEAAADKALREASGSETVTFDPFGTTAQEARIVESEGETDG